MRNLLLLIGVILLHILAPVPVIAQTPPAIIASNSQAAIQFPEKVTFQVHLEGGADITEIILEYGVDQLTCGKLVAESFPDFQPAKTVDAQWSWEMKQSGSLPPGAKIWWRWRVKDASGSTLVTDTQRITWLDSAHAWQSRSKGSINLHWYKGDDAYVQELLDNAVDSLAMLEKNIGLKPDGAIDLYIYASSQELTDSVYFMPDWTGGLAYSAHNIILIGIAPDEMTWGKHAETHELTHVLVGRRSFSCLGDMPTWLNEGLAKYSEGEWDEASQKQLKDAIASDALMSVRALSSSFPEDSKKANLAYTQSQSLVSFLIQQYGQEKILNLLSTISKGTTIDDALQQVYGFNQDGLEDAWRAKMGAAPRSAALAAPTATQPPTAVPTIVPISGVPPVITQGPPLGAPEAAGEPTSVFSSPGGDQNPSPLQPSSLIWVGGALLCFLGLAAVAILFGVVLFVRRQRRG